MSNVQRRKRRYREKRESRDFGKEASIGHLNPDGLSLGEQGHQLENIVKKDDSADADTMYPRPYEFLKYENPPLHTILVPHFKLKSLTFALTALHIIAFLSLIIFSYSKPKQSSITWNCSLYQLQNKYYPSIRYQYQFWRILTSGVFHSNILHFLLNLAGLQIYGYFIEWYYGKLKFLLTIATALLFSFLLSCLALPTSVSTMTSSILYSFLILKGFFFLQYWCYDKMQSRKKFLCLLWGLIFAINIIPITVSNNVDFTCHLGGVVSGMLLGLFFHLEKKQGVFEEKLTRMGRVLKVGAPACLALMSGVLLSLMFALEDVQGLYKILSSDIIEKCSNSA